MTEPVPAAEYVRALDDVKWLWRIVYAQAFLIGFLAMECM